MKVYKLVRKLKNGSLKPLFIGKKKPFVIGEKMKCEYLPTKGFAPRSVDDNQSGGWHCCFQPVAPHLTETLKTGEERVWLECEAEGTTKTYHRGDHQGGDWILAEYITPLREMPWEEVRQMQAASPKKSLFKKGDVVWVSGDISNEDYNCRVDSQGVVEADQKTARSKVLVTIDYIDGDQKACLSVDPKLLTVK